MKTLEWRSKIAAPAEALYRYHVAPGAFSRLCPPWERVRLEGADEGIREGLERRLKIGYGPFSVGWTALHENFEEGRGFTDRQLAGPFSSWVHQHRFEAVSETESELVDRIDFRCPGGLPLGGLIEARAERAFAYRHRQTARDVARIVSYPGPCSPLGGDPLTVGITGASGLVGSRLAELLRLSGHRVVKLVRGGEEATGSDRVAWWPEPNLERLEGLDAVVHLAGEPVAQLWTAEARERIAFSRTEGTRRLANALASLSRPPRTLICASAIGIYDTEQAGMVAEWGALGSDFLAKVCSEWEAAASPAYRAGIRVCWLRTGLVLSPSGGLLAAQLPAFRLGLGVVLGDGLQPLSFVDIDDLVGAAVHLLHRSDLEGAFNGTAPYPVCQAIFARELAKQLGRPLLLRIPEGPLRFLLGEQSQMLLVGVPAVPERLERSGFEFHALKLEQALAHHLG